MAASEEEVKRVRDMSYPAHETIYKLLRPDVPGRDWKTLADRLNYSNEDINYFACERRPVKALIENWEKSNATINELLSHLEKMERQDLVEDLQLFIDDTPTPSEAQKRKKGSRVMMESETECSRLPTYDALLIYAPEDQEFANEILKKLEGSPYNMQVCIKYRDFVSGGCKYEKAAEIIEKRCKKILVIFSENFTKLDDGEEIFQAKIALHLSPGIPHAAEPFKTERKHFKSTQKIQ